MNATCELDERVNRALAALDRHKVQRPAALVSLAIGAGVALGRLEDAGRLPFSRIDGAPERWRDTCIHYGRLQGSNVWVLEDAPLDAEPGEPAWSSAFPIWLAGAAGASTLIHVCAGASTQPTSEAGLRAGTIALVRDHLNLSGGSPLVGLGASRLGAQFPDQTRVHDGELRKRALKICADLGLHAQECVAACSIGPTLETPAERRAFALHGAQVSAQRLIEPLHAAAHCGLGVLALVLVVQEAGEALDIAKLAARSHALAPAVDDLIASLVRAARAEAIERSREGRRDE